VGFDHCFRKEQVDRELDEELRAYLEMQAAEKMKQGMNRMGVRALRWTTREHCGEESLEFGMDWLT